MTTDPAALTPEHYEKLGLFYLGRPYDLEAGEPQPGALLYDSRDLLTHALCVGMTGSGKTGLCISLLEEAAIDGVPSLVIDPKGDLANLLLTFPDLAAKDFLPWVEEAAAQRQGISREELAAREAEKWRNGLASWGQGADRVRRLRDAAEVALYTPGSTAGRPLAVLASLAAPGPALREDLELLRERAGSTAGGLLGLVGIEADPVRSREHILLTSLIERYWSEGRDLDLAALVQQVQRPPITQVGVLDVETFFPEKERFGLAMAINNVLASPGFASWREGEPLDIGKLLYTPAGRPRIAICSIAHLGDRERMFFVTLLLEEMLGWVRSQSGTSTLRALLYMDEVFGYFPPVAEPPSKRPLLTLLKQARAFGVGIVLATQNPVDLDYKGLANIGTWFLGRLQADRDKQRLLDGLEGAAQGAGPSRAELDGLLSKLRQRVFLLHNVHEDAPVVFETRWAMSYLRGPLTRQEIRKLTAETAPEAVEVNAAGGGGTAGASGAAAGAGSGLVAPSVAEPAPSPRNPAASTYMATPPVLVPPGVLQLWEPAPAGSVFEPWLAGWGRAWYRDARKGVEHATTVMLAVPVPAEGGEPTWDAGLALERPIAEHAQAPSESAEAGRLPASAGKPASWRTWEASFKRHLRQGLHLTLWRHPGSGLVSRPGEGERELRIRIAEAARAQRSAQLDAVRAKYGKQAAAAAERVRRAEEEVARQEGQLRGQKTQTAISVGATVLSVLLGRKMFSGGAIGKATTAARGYGRAQQEAQDVAEAQQKLAAAREELAEIERRSAAEMVEAQAPAGFDQLEPLKLLPKEVEVGGVALLWRRG
jgi:hypothetical protein